MHELSLCDAQGKPHTYAIQPHPAGEGTRLVLQLMAMAAEPLGRLLESKLAELITKFSSGELDMDTDVKSLAGELGDVAWSQVAGDLRRVLADVDGPALIRDLLRYTTRDGQKLAEPGAYDVAYQQNYIELLKAAAYVIQVNGFLGFTRSLASG